MKILKTAGPALLLVVWVGSAQGQPLERINPDGLPKNPNITQVVRAGKLLFISGQVGITPDGKIVGAGMKEQLDQALTNLATALRSQGADFSHLAQTTVYVTSMEEYRTPEVLALRLQRFGAHVPTGTLVQVVRLADAGYKVEVEAVAVLP